MLNFIWVILILISFVTSGINGRIEAITSAIIASAGETIKIFTILLGTTCLWSGIMKVASKSGIMDFMAFLLTPITRKLFPKIVHQTNVMNLIIMNMVANILGMSNAATPLGLKAMQELQKINTNPSCASDEMCLFVSINTACLQLIPTTIIALRKSFGSSDPFEIILPSIISSMSSVLVAILASKIFAKFDNIKFNKSSHCKSLNHNKSVLELGDSI